MHVCDENLLLVVESSSSFVSSCGIGDARLSYYRTAMVYALLRAENLHSQLPVFVTLLSHDTGFHRNSSAHPLLWLAGKQRVMEVMGEAIYHRSYDTSYVFNSLQLPD